MRQYISVEVEGILSVYTVPHGMSDTAWQGLGFHEKNALKGAEYENQIMTNGYTAISNFLGANGTVPGFALYLALGNGAINGVNIADTGLAHETQRLTSSSSVLTGNVTTVTFPLAYASSNVQFTEAGLIGAGGTSTLGTGQLNTHLLFPFLQNSYTTYSLIYTLIRY